MINLKAALKAFWAILLDRPHVYCDHQVRSMVGDLEEICEFVEIFDQEIEDAVEQHNLLNEAYDLLNDHK